MIRAARYLGVPPWELVERSSVWTVWALAAESAEAYAVEQQARRERQRHQLR